MSKIIRLVKQCLACGTQNPLDAKVCKKCTCPLLAEVEVEEDILSLDPMENAFKNAVIETAENDDTAAQFLREQVDRAKKTVAKEKEKEVQKQKINLKQKPEPTWMNGPARGVGRFKLGSDNYSASGEDNANLVRQGGVSLRMQMIRQNQNSNKKPGANK